MEKAEGAFLTIGELAGELGVPQHVLRYWETRFPQLRPMQRSGNRRYYRPADAALARRIHHLLSIAGYTVRGAQQALAEGGAESKADSGAKDAPVTPATAPGAPDDRGALIARLQDIRDRLAAALD